MSTVENPLVPPPGTLDAGLRTGRRELLHQLLRSRTFLVGLAILVFWVACAVVGERLTPNDPYETGESVLTGPDATNWFGTDKIGRDVFARVVAGARDILIVAPLATLLGTVLGTIFGLVVGYYRGLVDDVISRVIDAVLALPLIIFAVTVVAALGTSRATVIVVIGVVFTPLIARTVRATVLSERELDYVQAAKLRRTRPLHHVRRDPPERDGADSGRVHRPARLRDLRRRVAQLHRIRAPATLTRLGGSGLRALLGRQLRLVDRALPVPRDRLARGRGEPDRGRDHARARVMNSEREAASDAALELRELDVAYRVRGRDRQVLRELSCASSAESYGLVGESGCGKSTAALAAVRYLPRNGRVRSGTVLVDGRNVWTLGQRELRQFRANAVSMVYQNPAPP